MSLVDKYRPKCFEEIKGQEKVVSQVKNFVENFPRKKALLLHGPAGTGKTSIAYALASELNSEIIELNASDLRDKESIKKILTSSSQQQSLFNIGNKNKINKILLVDEIEGITRKDYGGVTELMRLIKKTNYPIILTANDPWDKKFSKLRRKVKIVNIKPLNYQKVFSLLKKIAEKEEINTGENLLKSLAIKSKGDVRAALNDLQTANKETTHEEIHERDREEEIFNVLKQVFQQKPNKSTLWLYDKVNMPLDKIFLWVEENIPKAYQGEELYKAFQYLSKADVFRGRIYRQQHWRFLVYENFLLSAGISSSKKEPKLGFIRYKKPGRILKIWLSNRKQKYKKSISRKYAKHCHISSKRAMKEFGIIKELLKNSKAKDELDLDKNERGFLEKIN